MSDLIDRVEAIMAIKEYADKHAFNSYYSGMNRACKVLLTVPSAEPEIIYCKDCKHYDGRPCGIVNWYNTESDFCSRAERKENR